MIALGSSTRNKYPRGEKILENNISNGTISSNGTGIGNLLKDLFYPEKGVSKPRKTLQEKIYSNQCNISIQKIVKLSKIIKSGDFSSIGFSGNIFSYSNGEISEVFCEYLGIENDEVLKTSFKESIFGLDIVKDGLSVVDVIAKYIKNVVANVFKQFTFEDSLDNLLDMTEEMYENEVEQFTDDNILPMIYLEIEEIDFEDENENHFDEVNLALKNIMTKLQKVGE